MREFFRRLKISYLVYNFFHKKQLQHNIPVYKKLGLSKSYFSPVSTKDFKNIQIQEPQPNWDKVKSSQLFQQSSELGKTEILSFHEKGYSIIRNFLSSEQVDAINKEVDSLMADKKVKFRYKNKLMFAFHQSELIRSVGKDKSLHELMSALIGADPILFQSINFIMGSEQDTHSDSIHMTTFPVGGLVGAWFALDEITNENGPLHYYPGSHKLPYYMNGDYDNEGNFFLIGDKSYEAYEAMIAQKIKEHQIKKEVFTAQKGDLLLWHANLFHGGEPHRNKTKTRKSMVFHYFRSGSVCYHEITQRPALIQQW